MALLSGLLDPAISQGQSDSDWHTLETLSGEVACSLRMSII